MSDAARLVVIPVRLPGDYARFEEIRRAVGVDGVGGLLLFGGDLEITPPFLRDLRRAASGPLIVMSDVERGVGQQVEGCLGHPPPMAVGALRDPQAAYKLGVATAVDCRRVGIDMALAPVLDLYNEPRNPIIGPRSFGEDPRLVASLGAAWIAGCQDEGVLACAKHFPGHGRTLADSHDDLPRVDASEKELRAEDLVPFFRAVEARVGAVMTAHVAYPGLDPAGGSDLPATLSRPILSGLLRGEMGYEGLILTDALIMEGVRRSGGEGEAAVASLEAGCDVLLCPTDHAEVIEAVEKAIFSGRLEGRVLHRARERLEEALGRLSRRPTAREVEGMDEYRAYAMAKAAVTTLRDPSRLLPHGTCPPGDVLAVVLDDDDRPGREAPVGEWSGVFGGGILRRTPTEGEDAEILARAAVAERVFLFLYGDVRAWKGRPGLHPDLAALARALEEHVGDRMVQVAFGSPALVVEGRRSAAVAAWGDHLLVQRAALDLLMGGRSPTGRLPWGPDPLP